MYWNASESRRLALLLPALAAVLGSCGAPPLRAELPDGFLQLRTPPRELKATTADDARLWVREFVAADGGTLEFWTTAVRHELVEGRGLVAIGEPGRITDDHGRSGSIQLFQATHDGLEVGYLCALFVTPRGERARIRVAEFTAPRPRFDELLPAVRQTLGTLTR